MQGISYFTRDLSNRYKVCIRFVCVVLLWWHWQTGSRKNLFSPPQQSCPIPLHSSQSSSRVLYASSLLSPLLTHSYPSSLMLWSTDWKHNNRFHPPFLQNWKKVCNSAVICNPWLMINLLAAPLLGQKENYNLKQHKHVCHSFLLFSPCRQHHNGSFQRHTLSKATEFMFIRKSSRDETIMLFHSLAVTIVR